MTWNRFDSATGVGRLTSFVFAIIDTLQNWHDNAQSRVPGYRDRLVHISQAADEGGLNLRMMSETITRLSERGRRAGIALVERFGGTGPAPGPVWDEHRWVRLRSTVEQTVGWSDGPSKAIEAPCRARPTSKIPDEDSRAAPDIYQIAAGSQPAPERQWTASRR